MRLVSKLFAIAVIVCVAFSACQKEISEDDLNPPVNTPSAYLDKVYYVDSTSVVKDTFRIVAYVYDGQKRVVKIIDSSDVGPSFEILPESSYEYYYNGADTIPYKSLYQKYSWASTTSPAIDSQTIFHFYDASLNRIKDSVSSYTSNGTDNWYIRTYVHAASSITEVREVAPGVFENTTTRLDSRGNMILGEAEPDGIFQYEFDNHPSPFAKLSNFRALEIWLDVESVTDFYLLKNNNNFTKNTDLWPSQSVFDVWDLTGDYTYRADGYPARAKDEYEPGEFEILEFTYKTL